MLFNDPRKIYLPVLKDWRTLEYYKCEGIRNKHCQNLRYVITTELGWSKKKVNRYIEHLDDMGWGFDKYHKKETWDDILLLAELLNKIGHGKINNKWITKKMQITALTMILFVSGGPKEDYSKRNPDAGKLLRKATIEFFPKMVDMYYKMRSPKKKNQLLMLLTNTWIELSEGERSAIRNSTPAYILQWNPI